MDFYDTKPHTPPSFSDDAYDQIIREAADAHDLEVALIKAVIKAESSFNPHAVSRAGAMGLMQIMPANCDYYGVTDPFDPTENVSAGTRYLKKMLTRYGDDLHRALAAYNAGPGAVERHGGIPPYDETQQYVRRVEQYLQERVAAR